MKAILKREIQSYFVSPIAYIVLAIFYALGGTAFNETLRANMADLSGVFGWLVSVAIFMVPIITMRLFSEEKKQKTDQALFTAPVNLISIVIGKFLAALSLFFLCIIITLFYAFVISGFTWVDWSVIIGNFFGLFLLGAALISAGMFFSALTESQVIAAMAGFGLGFLILTMDSLVQNISQKFFADILRTISFADHYRTFTLGVLKLEDIVFFLSVCVVFVFLTVRVFEKKRWS